MKSQTTDIANVIITGKSFVPDNSIMPDNRTAQEWLTMASRINNSARR